MDLYENEIAKDIEGYTNYMITNFGRIWSKYGNGKWLNGTIDAYGYKITAFIKNNKQHRFKIHRLVALAFIENIFKYDFIDHIDGDKINNNVCNLRWATNQQNQYNSKLSSANVSGVKGVCWDIKKKKWKAFISINKKLTYLGSFNTIEEARIIRQSKANEVYGIFTNSCEKI